MRRSKAGSADRRTLWNILMRWRRVRRYLRATMANSDSHSTPASAADLKIRLERFRRRLEAEGRKRSLKIVDRAIRDVKGPDRD